MSAAPISSTGSDFVVEQLQLSVESKRSSQNGFINDAASQSSNSLFDRNSFQHFTQKKLQNIMNNNEFSKLIKFREECLVFREKREKKLINKMFKAN